MPFLPIPPAWIQAGLPTKEELFQYIADNQDSFNTDIEALKQTSQIDIIDVKISGEIADYTQAEIQQNMPVFKAPVSATITSVQLTLLEVSTSGTLQVDIEKSTDDGINWSTLLTTPVDLTGTTVGSKQGSVNFINTAAQDFNQNDLIRISIPGVQVDQGAFHVSIYGEVS
jgi:hypothetical protein